MYILQDLLINIVIVIKPISGLDTFMANVIFEARGQNYQVPGLPYEETFRYVRPVLLDDVPTIADLERLLGEADAETLTNPWSLPVVRGFQAYIPTTFKRVTHGMPPELLTELFGVEETWVPEAERVLLQLQTEIEAKAATIDAAIIHGRRERGTVVNKAHLLNRIYLIGRLYNHLNEREYPFLFGDLSNESQWDKALSDIKLQFIDYMLEVPVGKRRYPKRVRQVDVSKKDLSTKYSYI